MAEIEFNAAEEVPFFVWDMILSVIIKNDLDRFPTLVSQRKDKEKCIGIVLAPTFKAFRSSCKMFRDLSNGKTWHYLVTHAKQFTVFYFKLKAIRNLFGRQTGPTPFALPKIELHYISHNKDTLDAVRCDRGGIFSRIVTVNKTIVHNSTLFQYYWTTQCPVLELKQLTMYAHDHIRVPDDPRIILPRLTNLGFLGFDNRRIYCPRGT